MDKTKLYVADIETYPNCFTIALIRADCKYPNIFEVSDRRNEVERVFAFLDYLHDNNLSMVGFNSINFDYPVLHELMKRRDMLPKTGKAIAQLVYRTAQKQIESFKGDGFGNTVKREDWWFNNVDLFKIHHFDNKARATSLKLLEFNMRKDNISDLPYPVGSMLRHHEIDVLKQYNMHDVMCTLDFLDHSIEQIDFREQLSLKYSRDFTNHNDTKIGKDYFVMRLEEAGIATRKQQGGRSVMVQSKRPYIDIRDCLFSYYDFSEPAFIAVMDWFKNQRITETKGVFTDILEKDLGDVAKYAALTTKRKKLKEKPTDKEIEDLKKDNPLCWVEEVELKAREPKKLGGGFKKAYWYCWKIADNLNVIINGFQFDFGTGGIHGSVENKDIKENETFMLLDADASSMYPNLAISNRVYPEHLTEKFCDIYQDVYEQRKSFKKGSAENAMMKLALNGVYGDSNNQYSVFYDPKYTMSITVNGQLSLCLLAEKLMRVKGLKIIQVNTDGITVALPRVKEKQYLEICHAWEQQVGLQLEYSYYSRMIVRDVNNYIAVYTDGKVKRKGAYQYEGLGWHQNQGGLVVQKAAEACMIHGTDIEQFVKSHTDNYDFMLRVKVPRSSRLVLEYSTHEEEQQNVCRYFVATDGGKLVKIMPPLEEGGEDRRLSIDAEWNVLTCNDIKEFDRSKINYDYYVSEAKKLLVDIEKDVDTPISHAILSKQ